jgi:hypothetical protein
MTELVGTSRLAEFVSRKSDGRVDHPFGERPVGFLVYTADGDMSVHFASPDRRSLSVLDLSHFRNRRLRLRSSRTSATAGAIRWSGTW